MVDWEELQRWMSRQALRQEYVELCEGGMAPDEARRVMGERLARQCQQIATDLQPVIEEIRRIGPQEYQRRIDAILPLEWRK